MKILNLYAGIGGNRKNWKGHKVTAVENDPAIAEIYRKLFPDDKVVVGDAHDYLLKHYKEFDLIWSSPPCQTHSSFRYNISVRYGRSEPVYPDMRLYQEILFLKYHAPKYWIVENVKPYYMPPIQPDFQLQRHYFWSNFRVPPKEFAKDVIRKAQIPQLSAKHGYDLSPYKLKNKRQVLRNCVPAEIGEYIISFVPEE